MLKSPAETYTFILIFEMPKNEREKKKSFGHKNDFFALILLFFNQMDDFYMLFNHHRTELNCTVLH